MSISLVNVSLGANIVLAAITGYYAYLTQRLLAANRKSVELSERQMEAEARPYIEVSPVVREGAAMFQLKICNSGRSAAKNLKMRLSPDFYKFHERNEKNLLQRLHPFSENIESFGPSMELVIDLGVGYRFFQGPENDAISPPRFTVHTFYSSKLKQYEETTVVDLNVFRGCSAAATGAVQELKEMNDKIEKLTIAVKDASGRLKDAR